MDFGRRVLRQMQKDGAKFLPRQGSLVLNWLCSCLFRSGRLDKSRGRREKRLGILVGGDFMKY